MQYTADFGYSQCFFAQSEFWSANLAIRLTAAGTLLTCVPHMSNIAPKSVRPENEQNWRTKPIPVAMALRAYLPKWLGGEMVYDAVVRTNHFESSQMLTDFLMEQCMIAIHRNDGFHVSSIRAHIQKLIDEAKAVKKVSK